MCPSIFQEVHSNEPHLPPSTSLLVTISNHHVVGCKRLQSTRSSYCIIKQTLADILAVLVLGYAHVCFHCDWALERTNQWIQPALTIFTPLEWICSIYIQLFSPLRGTWLYLRSWESFCINYISVQHRTENVIIFMTRFKAQMKESIGMVTSRTCV